MHHYRGRDAARLAYYEIGAGQPLVLFHGFIASARQWLDHSHMPLLAQQGYRLILPDLRGHGANAHNHDPAGYPADILAEDALALIEHLALPHDPAGYSIGGYSLGGQIVLRAMIRGARPACAIAAGVGMASATQPASNRSIHRALTALARGDVIQPGTYESQLSHWIDFYDNNPTTLTRVLDSLVPTTQAALRSIASRTLIAVGDHDDQHPDGHTLATVLRNAAFATIPGNHWTALTRPELTDALNSFVRSDR